MANFQFVLLLFIRKISWFLPGCNISQCPPKKKKKKEREKKNIPVRVGVSVFLPWPWHFQMKHTWRKNDKTVKEYWKQVGKQRWRTNTEKLGYGFPRRFLEVFFTLSVPYLLRFNSKKTKTQFLSYCLHKKTVIVLKAYDRCHDERWYRSLPVQILVLHSPQTFSHVGIHSRMARLWPVFRRKSQANR